VRAERQTRRSAPPRLFAAGGLIVGDVLDRSLWNVVSLVTHGHIHESGPYPPDGRCVQISNRYTYKRRSF